MADSRCPNISAADILEATQQRTEPVCSANADAVAYFRHLANTIEPPMCGGDAAFCQITLTTCLL